MRPANNQTRDLSPNAQLVNAARMLQDHAAPLTTAVLVHIERVIQSADGYPPATLRDGSRGTDTTSTTERTALHAVAGEGRDHEVYRMRCAREEIRDQKHTIVTLIRDYIGYCEGLLPKGDRHEVKRCDGRGFEGSHIPWIPHSRDERNGWHDATCLDAADESGLCAKCRIRERRWREKAGLKPRVTNAETEAA